MKTVDQLSDALLREEHVPIGFNIALLRAGRGGIVRAVERDGEQMVAVKFENPWMRTVAERDLLQDGFELDLTHDPGGPEMLVRVRRFGGGQA